MADETVSTNGWGSVPRAASGWGLAASTYVFAVVMMGTTLPTPLYPQYEVEFGFGNAQTTVLFMIGSNLGLLYAGRILSGLAAGIFTATGTVTVLENAPSGRQRLAASLATAANMGGLGLGILMAGLLARFAPGPLFTPYLVNAITLVIAGLALIIVRDRVRPNPAALRLQLPGIPAESRRIFLAACPGAIAGFTLCGLYSAIAPNFMGQTLHISSPAVTGTVVFLLFGASATAQLVFRGLADQRLIVLGSITMIISMAALVIALETGSLILLIASSLLAGMGQGLVFMTGMRAITTATRPERRTEATTSYFIVAYLAMSLPAVGAGLLASGIGLAGSTTVFAAAVACVCVVGLQASGRFAAK